MAKTPLFLQLFSGLVALIEIIPQQLHVHPEKYIQILCIECLFCAVYKILYVSDLI